MKAKKAFVIINESHSLFQEQESMLQERFDEIEFIKAPAVGWTLEEMLDVAVNLHFRASEADVIRKDGKVVSIHYPGQTENAVVFASPIPFMLKYLAKRSIRAEYLGDHAEESELYKVLVFHNDKREKKELPDGRIIQTVAATGWQLI